MTRIPKSTNITEMREFSWEAHRCYLFQVVVGIRCVMQNQTLMTLKDR